MVTVKSHYEIVIYNERYVIGENKFTTLHIGHKNLGSTANALVVK